MIWILVIAVVIIYFIINVNKESKALKLAPFIETYPVLIGGINEYLFNGEADFESKDLREHYLYKNSLAKIAYVQFIYKEDSIYLKYYDEVLEIKTTFSFQYSGTKYLSEEKQNIIAKDFSQRVKKNSKVSF
jgi:hypothetical protein